MISGTLHMFYLNCLVEKLKTLAQTTKQQRIKDSKHEKTKDIFNKGRLMKFPLASSSKFNHNYYKSKQQDIFIMVVSFQP